MSIAQRVALAGDDLGAALQALAEGMDLLLGRQRVQPVRRGEACSTPVVESVDVQRIFSHWRKVMGLRVSAKLTPERRKKIQARLKEGYSADRIIRAIDGCAGSDFHMARGKYQGQKKFNDLTMICRSGDKLEWFEAMPALKDDLVLRHLEQAKEAYDKHGGLELDALMWSLSHASFPIRSRAISAFQGAGSLDAAIEARANAAA